MAKVFGMHEIELQPGVQGEDLERFFREKLTQVPFVSEWKLYLLLLEIESVAARDRFAPAGDQLSPEGQQWWAQNAALLDEWVRLGTFVGQGIFTDYVVVVEGGYGRGGFN